MPEDYQQYDTHQKRVFWKNHVKQWQQSSLSQRAYCSMHCVKAGRFYYWRRRMLSPKGEISFLPVAVPESVTSRQKACAFRIHAPNNGFIVELDRPQDPQDVQQLISLLAAL